MIAHQAFRYELDPNGGQRVLLAKHAGCARFAWNWALGERVASDAQKFRGRILSATVRREADRWYVSLTVERERPDPDPIVGPVTGVDLGLNSFAVISDGVAEEAVLAPKPLGRSLSLLRRRSRAHGRKARGSRNRRRCALRLARLHRRIRNVRGDFLQKLSTTLAKTRFLASSKTCSDCGHVLESLALSVRKWVCPACGVEHDRDGNAAKNLVAWYRLATGSSPGSDACGEPSGGAEAQAPAGHGSAKQESALEDLSIG